MTELCGCCCWTNNHALGHTGHCCFTHSDRKVNGGWREDADICHVPVVGRADPAHDELKEGAAEDDAGGCHPLVVCTDRPELCPPVCRPVVRNAGANAIPPEATAYDPTYGLVARGIMSNEHDPESCEAACCATYRKKWNQ